MVDRTWPAGAFSSAARAAVRVALGSCFTKLYVKSGITYYSIHGSISAHMLPPKGAGTDMVTASAKF